MWTQERPHWLEKLMDIPRQPTTSNMLGLGEVPEAEPASLSGDSAESDEFGLRRRLERTFMKYNMRMSKTMNRRFHHSRAG